MATNQTFDIEKFKAQLESFDALRDTDEIQTGTLPHVQPDSADESLPKLHTSIQKALSKVGIDQFYQHQAEAIRKSLSGADVVLESPTASGKTLAFTVPMLDALVRDRGAHALMIYPMKALAYDQRIQIEQLCELLSIEAASYDGDTTDERKRELRDNPTPILLTNPEYLNMSFLAWRNLWEGFLCNLKYIVIDEMHEYRGFFGGNMALLLRRFFLHLKSIGANPRVFLSSATCANPKEHAINLTGRDDIEMVSAGNVLRPKRHFLFVNPDVPDYRRKEIIRLRVEQAALTVLKQRLRALVFCPTKRFLEEACLHCQRMAKKNKLDPEKIQPFHADIDSTEKQKIQQKIKDGGINVVFTTNALELGLDIGGLDGVILAGFPSNIMSAWQQIGRAGRGWDKEAFVLFYAMNDPIDQFFVGNLDAFLNKRLDELVVDPNNEELIESHLPMLKAETNGTLSASAKNILGSAFYDVARNNSGTLPNFVRPHSFLKVRGDLGQSYALKCDGEEIGRISDMRRFREAYIGAVFTFFGQKYSVHAHEKDAVVLTEAEQHLKTEASFYTKMESLMPFDGVGYGKIQMFYGALDLSMRFTSYKVIDEHTGEEIETQPARGSYNFDNRHAFWVSVPPSECATEGIGALEHIIRVGAMFVIPADRFDTSTYSKTGDKPFASYYENYSSGIGVAKKLFTILPDVLEKGIEIAENCKCRLRCQNCIEPAKSYNISNTEINKIQGIELAIDLLEAIERGPDQEFRNGLLQPIS